MAGNCRVGDMFGMTEAIIAGIVSVSAMCHAAVQSIVS
jgi:hypothetical protein